MYHVNTQIAMRFHWILSIILNDFFPVHKNANDDTEQGWGQIRFINYKYKWYTFFSEFHIYKYDKGVLQWSDLVNKSYKDDQVPKLK